MAKVEDLFDISAVEKGMTKSEFMQKCKARGLTFPEQKLGLLYDAAAADEATNRVTLKSLTGYLFSQPQNTEAELMGLFMKIAAKKLDWEKVFRAEKDSSKKMAGMNKAALGGCLRKIAAGIKNS
jgi:hypothetical protein